MSESCLGFTPAKCLQAFIVACNLYYPKETKPRAKKRISKLLNYAFRFCHGTVTIKGDLVDRISILSTRPLWTVSRDCLNTLYAH